MKLLAFVPIKLTLLLIIGILIGTYFSAQPHVILGITIVSFLCLGILYRLEKNKKSIWFGILASLTTVVLGIFIITKAQPHQNSHHYSKLDLGQYPVWHLKIREVLKPTAFSERYIAELKNIDTSYASGKLILNRNLKENQRLLNIDDLLLVSTTPTEISPPLNPYQFSYKAYLAQLGISHQLKLTPTNYTIRKNPSKSIYGIASNSRNHIIKKLKDSGFGSEELGVIQALLLGQRNDISKETYDNYKNAGAVHILALSGLHIGVLLLIIQFLLKPLEYLRNGKKIKLLFTVLLLWGFAFLAGLSPSIVRACTMFSFVAYALYLNRPSNTFNILALSMFFILLFINPNLLFRVGFQMSYAAVIAIVWIYPIFQNVWSPKLKLARYVWQLLSVSVAAQLGVLPISLFYFHQFPGLFFISNLLIIPVLGFILGTGILVIILALLNQLPNSLAWFFNELISYMNRSVAWVAQQEDFIFKNISFDFIQLILTYMVVVLFVLLLQNIRFKKLVLCLISLLSLQCYTIYLEFKAFEKNNLLILHQTKNTIILNRTGTHIHVLTSDSIPAKNPVRDIKIGERIETVHFDTLANSYITHGESLLLLDSLGVYPSGKLKGTVLLTQSPKVNLNRLIQDINPRAIIADGSNYNTYVKRWEATCKEMKIPFHYTGEKGFYMFD